jgi:DNA-directed RNA polymerase specialized sigma24 family protein
LLTDAAIVKDCLAGKQTAWNELVTRFTPALVDLTRRHNLTIQDAEDVIQRTWKQVFMKLSQLKETESLGAWIMRIAWHILADFYRAHKMVVPLMEDVPAQNGDMQHSAEIRETFERIGRRLVGNEAKVWKAMTDQLTLDDWAISRATGLPLTTCHTTRMRVEAKVREEIDRQTSKTHVPKTGS